jgi:hypothetical protein
MFRRNAQQEPAEAAKRAAAAGHPAGSARTTSATMTERACCCPARPQVKVIMPPTAARPDPVDLWLCGHHYRESGAALMAAGAHVVDLSLEPAAG